MVNGNAAIVNIGMHIINTKQKLIIFLFIFFVLFFSLSANKPVILVVLHETNDRNPTLAESSRQVHDLNVVLTVDFLFCNEHLLQCSCNNKSWAQIQNHLGHSNQLISKLLNILEMIHAVNWKLNIVNLSFVSFRLAFKTLENVSRNFVSRPTGYALIFLIKLYVKYKLYVFF